MEIDATIIVNHFFFFLTKYKYTINLHLASDMSEYRIFIKIVVSILPISNKSKKLKAIIIVLETLNFQEGFWN